MLTIIKTSNEYWSRGTGTGEYRGYTFKVWQMDTAPDPRDEYGDQCTDQMLADYRNGHHVYAFKIDGMEHDGAHGSYYYGADHYESGLMFDIEGEIDSEIDMEELLHG